MKLKVTNISDDDNSSYSGTMFTERINHRESNKFNNKFDNVDYLILDSDEMDSPGDLRNDDTHREDGEDEFSTYFTDQQVEIPEDNRVSHCNKLFVDDADLTLLDDMTMKTKRLK